MEVKTEDEEEATDNSDDGPKAKKPKIFSEEKQKMLQTEKVCGIGLKLCTGCNYNHFFFQMNQIRNKHHINVHGSNPPDPIETFPQLVNDYSIPQQIVDNLIACGYKEPTPIQMQAIPIMASVSLISCKINFVLSEFNKLNC